MLFNVRPGLLQSSVFNGLNCFLREVLLAALDGRDPDENSLPSGLQEALTDNEKTMELVFYLAASVGSLDPLTQVDLRAALQNDLDPCKLLTDKSLTLPPIPDEIFATLKALAVHLYLGAAKYAGVETTCGECIDDHYARFRADAAPGNGNVCCVCGTEYLAAIRSRVDDTEQWRGPYDHLLAKDEYPFYGVHPQNLLPICHTCNSKAKLVKDLLHDPAGLRRFSFNPWSEVASTEEVIVIIDVAGITPVVTVEFTSDDPIRQEKLNTWDAVYQIKTRVEGEFLALREKVKEDVSINSEQAFVKELYEKATAKGDAARLTPFNHWRALVFHAVLAMDAGAREALRISMNITQAEKQRLDTTFFK